jgi:phenylalanyl-tRNA synthetase beta chain
MKVSLSWLQDFIELSEQNPEELSRRITSAVGEVDDLIVQGELLQKCCIGKVTSVEKHPNADRLSICAVETNEGLKRVVCGGSNLRVGMFVAFAHVGARVKWHGTEMVTLEPTKIRGEQSEGMICAAEELDLTDRFPQKSEKEIIDLPAADADAGKGLREFLGLTDVVFHIDNHAITHRADLFSHIGVARELVALGLATWKEKSKQKAFHFTKDPLSFVCHNEIKDLIPRYCSCLVQIDGIGETPDWMKKRLETTGWRSVSLPVDITNYVMMEVGMPLHVFDANDFRGDIHMRLSKKGESLVTLDEAKRDLPDGAVVISDDEGIFDLLGVMGGLRSSTKESTKRLYLHSAAVDPVAIRRAIVATGHRTDASTVYEKGIPRIVVEQGFYRALELILEHVPGAKIVSQMETWGEDGTPKTFELPLERITKVIGTPIEAARATKIFTDLGFTAKATRGKSPSLTVTTPLWRLGDIKGEHDLIEEVGRIIGYDSIEPVIPSAGIAPPARDPRIHKFRDALKVDGYVEILPLSLTSPSLLKKAGEDPSKALAINNPIGEELSLLHASTLPALLEHAQRSLPLTDGTLRTFHWSHVFGKDREEHDEISLLLAKITSKDLKEDPFLLLKRDVEYALEQMGYHATVLPSPESPVAAHPGQSGDIHVDGHHIGTIATLHPRIAETFELPAAAFVTLNLTALLELRPEPLVAHPLPQFPAVSYDDTIDMDATMETGDLLKKAHGSHKLLENIEIIDLYRGSKHKQGEYNLTLRFTYRTPDRTLTEEEAKKAHHEVLKEVKK